MDRGKTSMAAANFFAKSGQREASEHSHRSRAVREWAEEFALTGTISQSKQGKHAKNISVLAHEDVKEKCIDWLKKRKPMQRDLALLKQYIDNDIVPSLFPEITSKISIATIRTYIQDWGFKYRRNTKGIYFDGHERPDVVQYRQEWAKRMMFRKKNMEDYDGDEMERVIEPNVERNSAKKRVMLNHDESIFYANDGKEKGWFLEGETQINGKGLGLSIMVSEFQCPCQGTMRHYGMISRTLFYAGANLDGYCGYEDMVKRYKSRLSQFSRLFIRIAWASSCLISHQITLPSPLMLSSLQERLSRPSHTIHQKIRTPSGTLVSTMKESDALKRRLFMKGRRNERGTELSSHGKSLKESRRFWKKEVCDMTWIAHQVDKTKSGGFVARTSKPKATIRNTAPTTV